MRKKLFVSKEGRDSLAKYLKVHGATTVIRRTTGPQNIDPVYVEDADHSMNGEYRTYFRQLYAVEWEDSSL